MTQMYVIGEDSLCCAIGSRLVSDVLGWSLAQPAVDKKGITRLLSDLPRMMSLAAICPVLCLCDTDGKCAVDICRTSISTNKPQKFLFRLAVTEIESWLIADRSALAEFLQVSEVLIPDKPDTLRDAKLTVLNLARRSKQRRIRQEVVSSNDSSKPGFGYNVHLREFASKHWHHERAEQRSPSLSRAVRRLLELKID